ncbi:hypothetical protein BKA65DRAFT_584133 [Rhexocercosporidium sp. MPI-PUGE-AT-0058]|nr:hypothetical protein BKA65DRAFT_584133 [Rhexocercosporidium sp. MPI-PUGE-AT-0058]
MTPRLWDAYDTLRVIDRDSKSMDCAGLQQDNQQCDVKLDDINYLNIRRIIDTLEIHPPDENSWSKSLKRLASLSVCSTCQHNEKANIDELVDEWKLRIAKAAQKYKRRLAKLEVHLSLEKKDEEIVQLKRTIEKLESRGICKLHIEIEDLQSELEAEKSEHLEAISLAISELKKWNAAAQLSKSHLRQSKDKVAEVYQQLGEAEANNEVLSTEIQVLRSDQASSLAAYEEGEVALGKAKAENSFLLSRVVELEDALERERTVSSVSITRLQGRLEAAIISRVKLGKVETSLLSQLDENARKLQETTNVIGQLNTEINTLMTVNTEMLSVVAKREKNTDAMIAVLIRRIDFIRNHPFNMLLVSLMVSIKGWEGVIVGGLWWLRSWMPFS